ncbi:hypothetical protein LSAT2_022730, partial [Lamellibrachia satsuma]
PDNRVLDGRNTVASTVVWRHNNRVPVALWKPEPAQNVACLTGLRSNPIPEGLYRLPTYKIRPESAWWDFFRKQLVSDDGGVVIDDDDDDDDDGDGDGDDDDDDGDDD